MDKLRRVLSGQEDNEERGLTEQVGGVWQLRDKALMLTFEHQILTFRYACFSFFLQHNIHPFTSKQNNMYKLNLRLFYAFFKKTYWSLVNTSC